jgi:hypothetical protein
MTEQQQMAIEQQRVRMALDMSLEEIEQHGGNVRFFGAALICAAMRLHVELEGTDGLERAMTSLVKGELVRAGKVKPT